MPAMRPRSSNRTLEELKRVNTSPDVCGLLSSNRTLEELKRFWKDKRNQNEHPSNRTLEELKLGATPRGAGGPGLPIAP